MRALGCWVVQHAWERAGHDADAATAAAPCCSVSGSPGQIGAAAAAAVASAVRGPARGRLTIGAAARFSRVLRTSTPSSVQHLWHRPIVEAGVSRRCCPARRPGPNHGWRCQAHRYQAWLVRCVPSTAGTRCPTTQKALQPTLVGMLRVHGPRSWRLRNWPSCKVLACCVASRALAAVAMVQHLWWLVSELPAMGTERLLAARSCPAPSA